MMEPQCRREFLKRAGSLAATGALMGTPLAREAFAQNGAGRKPNIIFVFADDLGWGDLGCYGHNRIKTPHLDRLAKEGTLFADFTVASPVCSPSRAAVMTGLFPARAGIHGHIATPAHNRDRGMPNQLDPSLPTLPRSLRGAGYATGHVGKWHLGQNKGESPSPLAYGYDWQKTVLSADTGLPFERTESTRMFVDGAIEFIDANKDRPFFLNLWLLHPHSTLDPTDRMMAPYSNLVDPDVADKYRGALQVYYGVVTHIDEQVGRLLGKLDELGLAKDTLVVFSSDNGPEDIHIRNATHSGVGSPGPFRGRKRSLYEGGIRAPFIARWPGHVPSGRVDRDTVINGVDLYPTFCALGGTKAAPGIDGEDMSGAFLGTSMERSRPLMWEWRFGIAGYHIHRSPMLAIRDGEWKLLMNPDGSRLELYNLRDDPSETDNKADIQPELASRLSKQLTAWQATLPKGPVSRWAGSNAYNWPK